MYMPLEGIPITIMQNNFLIRVTLVPKELFCHYSTFFYQDREVFECKSSLGFKRIEKQVD